jgi:cellobiose-specific phosphotransferase system component IIC
MGYPPAIGINNNGLKITGSPKIKGSLMLKNAGTNEIFDFGTVQMLDQFATIGGAGCTIGLAIAMAIVGHSSRMKAMSG